MVKENCGTQQQLPKSGGSVVKSSFVSRPEIYPLKVQTTLINLSATSPKTYCRTKSVFAAGVNLVG